MKFNHVFYPLLKELEKPLGKGRIGFHQDISTEIAELMTAWLALNYEAFQTNIKYITVPIIDFCRENIEQLSKQHLQLKNTNGVFLYPTTNRDKHHQINMIMYSVYRDECEDGLVIRCMMIVENGVMDIVQCNLLDDGDYVFSSTSSEIDKGLRQFLFLVFSQLTFLQYAEVETVIVDGSGRKGKRRVKMQGEKHISECNLPIEIIDSSYFRKIVREGEIDVMAHIRWQACGKNWSERKMTIVRAHERKGYTRKAKIES